MTTKCPALLRYPIHATIGTQEIWIPDKAELVGIGIDPYGLPCMWATVREKSRKSTWRVVHTVKVQDAWKFTPKYECVSSFMLDDMLVLVFDGGSNTVPVTGI